MLGLKTLILIPAATFVWGMTHETDLRTLASVVRHEAIVGWEDIVVEKGFILSNDLYYKRMCSKIWKKQVPTFAKENPQVKDVDKFWPGDKIRIQICQDYVPEQEAKIEAKKEEKVVAPVVVEEKTVTVVEEAVVTETTTEESVVEEQPAPPAALAPDLDSTLYIGGGFLTESQGNEQYTNPSLTFRIRSDFYTTLSHRLYIDASPSIILVRNKIDFRTKFDQHQYFLSVGMGNRIGTKTRENIRLSNNISNFAEASVGMILRKSPKVNILMEVGTTLNSNYPVNFSVMATKRLGNSEFHLGGYFDYIGTDTGLLPQETADRRLLTGGLIFSY